MNLPSLRPTRPFFLSLFAVAVLAAKLLHLVQHGRSVGILQFLLYLPTFFIPDILVIALMRLVLHGYGSKLTALSVTGLLVGSFIACVFCSPLVLLSSSSLVVCLSVCQPMLTGFVGGLGPSALWLPPRSWASTT